MTTPDAIDERLRKVTTKVWNMVASDGNIGPHDVATTIDHALGYRAIVEAARAYIDAEPEDAANAEDRLRRALGDTDAR